MLVNSLGRIAPILLLAALGCGGEIVGMGNSGNVIGAAGLDRLAEELAESPVVPAVSDDDLRAVFAAIRENALEGDPKAALVLVLLAAEQRDESE